MKPNKIKSWVGFHPIGDEFSFAVDMPCQGRTGSHTFSLTYNTTYKNMGIIASIIIGLIVGAIAKLLMPGRDPGGWIITIVIGLAGSFIGGFLGRTIGLYREGEPAGWIASVIGAMILLAIYRFLNQRGAR